MIWEQWSSFVKKTKDASKQQSDDHIKRTDLIAAADAASHCQTKDQPMNDNDYHFESMPTQNIQIDDDDHIAYGTITTINDQKSTNNN